jgi:hypothetical protein
VADIVALIGQARDMVKSFLAISRVLTQRAYANYFDLLDVRGWFRNNFSIERMPLMWNSIVFMSSPSR